MERNLTTVLFENFYEGNNETQITNRVFGTQTKDQFEDPGENLGRLEDLFKFFSSKKSDEKATYIEEE